MKSLKETYESINEAKKAITVNDYTITQKDIDKWTNKSGDATMHNYSAGDDGVAMRGMDIDAIDGDGKKVKVDVEFDLKKGEEADNQSIYQLSRVLDLTEA